DVNSMKPLDFLGNPVSVLKETEELMADAFGADRAYLITGGTSFAVQTMILTTLRAGDKLIVPRNAHKSVINGLILSGASPVYLSPELDEEIGVSHNITMDELRQVHSAHPDAKAVLIINPTYYGATADLESIVDYCHSHGMFVLVDEAHGTHFHFHDALPLSGMQAGADMSAVSLHKTGGSLTQSSVLLVNTDRIDGQYVRKVINLMQTTSPSYLLMGSLDVARKMLATEGNKMLSKVLGLADYARKKINAIRGCSSLGAEKEGTPGIFRFDPTKLSISTRDMGLNGMQLYDMLRDEYNIQMETGDLYNSLAILSVGDYPDYVDALINAMLDISSKQTHRRIDYQKIDMHFPEVVLSPREAFYAPKEFVPLEQTLGRISGESIMSYPPGIPCVSYGERINESVIEQVKLFKSSHGIITGMEDPSADLIKVVIESSIENKQ
ncbi:MAG: aminotransferase class I/II-fold pyridoxal phosphate-dependent enzyme, partial [Bacillota bacterium]|nr:aminotransferase class I/II-fold pyridoxal phosphate-dependent enzyme [Bacillota bacterium]